MPYIGIDLGTTYSAAAYFDDFGRPSMVTNRQLQGSNLTPSVVMIDPENNEKLLVGEEARKQWTRKPDSAAGRFKSQMGTDATFEIDGRTWAPTDLSTKVLQSVKKDAEAMVGEIVEAVVTIPAKFSNNARGATLQAAKRAGLDVKYIIDEPTAAALYYALKHGGLNGTYVVYDFGGGTFDCSIVKILGGEVEVKASEGDTSCGGDDFDKALLEIVKGKYESQTGLTLRYRDEFKRTLVNDSGQTVYDVELAEQDKKSLSSRPSVLAGAGRDIAGVDVKVTREEFESKVSTKISQSIILAETAMREAGVTANDISGVFLVGGTTRVPNVRKAVDNLFGEQKVIESASVDEAVALGAAIFAALKSDQSELTEIQKRSLEKLSVQEVTHLHFGVVANIHSEELGVWERSNSIMVKKGSPIPSLEKEIFYTSVENQTLVPCTVTESQVDSTNLQWATEHPLEDLQVPPNRPKGQEIEVTMGFDKNKCLKGFFEDLETGEKIPFSFKFNPDRGDNDTDGIDGLEID